MELTYRALKFCVAATGPLWLLACASMPAVVAPPVMPESAAAQQLPPQTLLPNECALFVWTADAQKRFIVFSQSESQSALWYDGAQTMALALDGGGGEPSYGQYPVQNYYAADKTQLRLKLDTPEEIETGTRYKAGLLAVTAPDEWQRIVPVVGLSTCEAG